MQAVLGLMEVFVVQFKNKSDYNGRQVEKSLNGKTNLAFSQ